MKRHLDDWLWYWRSAQTLIMGISPLSTSLRALQTTSPTLLMERQRPHASNTCAGTPPRSDANAIELLPPATFCNLMLRQAAAYAFFGFLFFLPMSLTSSPVRKFVSMCSLTSFDVRLPRGPLRSPSFTVQGHVLSRIVLRILSN